jgi:hypothetical protein
VASVQELTQLLGNPAGERLLESLSPNVGQPQLRIINAVRYGIVLLVLGVTLFAAIGSGTVEAQNLDIVAIFAVGGGAGLLLAASASYVLARRMGVIRDDPRDTAQTGLVA